MRSFHESMLLVFVRAIVGGRKVLSGTTMTDIVFVVFQVSSLKTDTPAHRSLVLNHGT